MFDIGFWELLVIALVLLLVLGPERLPEVAKQAAFLVRKMRQGMFRLRSEMQSEIDSTPFADLQKARQEMNHFKDDIKQLGRELANSVEEKIDDGKKAMNSAESATTTKAAAGESTVDQANAQDSVEQSKLDGLTTAKNSKLDKPITRKKTGKKVAKKATKKVAKKATKKVAKKSTSVADQ